VRRGFALLVVSLLITLSFSGCAPQQTASSGVTITLAGSTSVQPFAEILAEEYMVKHPEDSVNVQGGGSSAGVTAAQSGAAEIGMLSRDLKGSEKTLKEFVIAHDAIAITVHPTNPVTQLTKLQAQGIFSGKINNWKEVGGDDMKIVIINRPKSSGTRATFKKYALNGADEAEGKALTEDQSGTVKKAIAETDGAISYLAFSYVDNTVKALKYDGVEATADNVKSGKYPIWAYEHMYTKGEATGLAKAYLDYLMSDDVQKSLVVELGYIPSTEMKTSR
jgi:phosphate transport system substrate-binding protein